MLRRSAPPCRPYGWTSRTGRPSLARSRPHYRVVSADFFRTMGIARISGRVFEPADARRAVPLIRWFPQQPLPRNFDAPQPAPVAVINEAMARQFWPDGGAVGRRFRALLSPWITVVGVVASTRNQSLSMRPVPEFYLHDLQEPQAGWSLLVRTKGDPADAAPAVGQAIRNLDAQLAVSSMLTIDDLAGTAFRVPRLRRRSSGASRVSRSC
jgi:putative ABC transport system permease protein